MSSRWLLPLLLLGLACDKRAAAPSGDWIDVTASLDPKTTPVFPGDAPLKFDFLKEIDKGDSLVLSAYTLGAHSGTHVDAPLHFIKGGGTVDAIPLGTFAGPARVIDCSNGALAIDAKELNSHAWRGATRILFRTRNSQAGFMSDPAFHSDFTYLAPDAARLLADAGVVLVGIDYISMEQYGARSPETHLALLGKNIPIVEGLDLKAIAPGDYELVVLPLRVTGHEAAPARAMLRKL